MGSTLSPDPTTRPFVSGMPRLVLQLANLWRGTLVRTSPWLTLLMGNTLFLHLMVKPFVCGAHPLHTSFQPPTSSNPTYPSLYMQPDPDGWVRDSKHGLLYWVPSDCRTGLHSPALLTIPLTSHIRSVSLDFEDFAFGTSWNHIFKCA